MRTRFIPIIEPQNDRVCLSNCLGTFCQALGVKRLLELVRESAARTGCVEVRASRIDLAFDNDSFKPGQAWECCKSGKLRTLVKRVPREVNGKLIYSFNHIEGLCENCETVMIGSRTSERYLRIYARMSGLGRFQGNKCTRVELECKGRRAAAVLAACLNAELDSIAKFAVGVLRDFVDFNAAWWLEFCGGAKRANMTLAALVQLGSAGGRAWQWLRKSCMPTLSALVEGAGGDVSFVLDQLLESKNRWREKQRMLVAEGQCFELAKYGFV